jgi:hypothetical protein
MAGDLPLVKVVWQDDRELTASLLSVQIEEHDRLIDKATVVIADPHLSAPEFAADQPLVITLGWEQEHAVLFSGLVIDAKGTAPADGVATITIVAYDLSVLMHREPCHDSHEGALSKIVGTIVDKYPKTPPGQVLCDPDPTFEADPPLIQHNLTDLQFLQWLAWRYGHRAFVEVNDGKPQFYFVSNHRLMSSDPLGVLQWCRGMRQLKEFRYERIASQALRQRVAAVPDPKTGEAPPIEGETPPPIDLAPPDQDRAKTIGRIDPAERERYEAGAEAAAKTTPPTPEPAPVLGLPSDPTLAEAVTTWDPTRVLGLRGKGTAIGTINLRAKGKVTIEGIPSWAAGDWYVSQAVHSWRRNQRGTSLGTPKVGTENGPAGSYETSFVVTR